MGNMGYQRICEPFVNSVATAKECVGVQMEDDEKGEAKSELEREREALKKMEQEVQNLQVQLAQTRATKGVVSLGVEDFAVGDEDLNSALLSFCIQQNKVDDLKRMLFAKVDPNLPDLLGNHPMHTAAAMGSSLSAKALIQAKADVNCIMPESKATPIYLASMKGHSDVVSMLLTAGADVTCRSRKGYTPLMIAAGQGHGHVTRSLLEARADTQETTIQNNKSYTAFSISITNNHFHTARLLACYCVNNPLILASHDGDEEFVKRLLSDSHSKVWINSATRDQEGRWTPLHMAAEGGSAACVELLLHAKAEPQPRDLYGLTPLDIAVQNKNTDVQRVLSDYITQSP